MVNVLFDETVRKGSIERGRMFSVYTVSKMSAEKLKMGIFDDHILDQINDRCKF